MESGWYFLSYDISGARHGRRVQRQLRKQAHRLLESLYLYKGGADNARQLLQNMRQLAGSSASEVVMYRLRQSQPIWVCGAISKESGVMDFSLPTLLDPFA